MGDHVIDNRAAGQYEMRIDGETAIAVYRLDGERIVFTHTGVPGALEGKGIASKLLAGALEDVRARGLKVVAQCPFVAAYLRRHREARDPAVAAPPRMPGDAKLPREEHRCDK